jgi:hypothetical protein
MSGLTGNELVRMFGPDGRRQGSGEDFYASTEAIAALAGGAAGGTVTTISTGTSYTSQEGDTFLCWATNTNGAKNTYIDTSIMADGQVMIVKDYFGGNYSQTIQALQDDVTIENEASYTMTPSNGVSVNLKFDAETSNLLVW